MVDKRKREIRARMAATGETYSRAARELGKQGSALDELAGGADPTATHVEAGVQVLLDRLRTRRPEAANPQCLKPQEFTRAIDRAMAAGLDLTDHLAASSVDQVAIDLANRLAEQFSRAQCVTVNRLNFTMVHDVADAYALVRTARAAQQRRCLLGQGTGRASDCSPGPERVRLRIYDDIGEHPTEPGCIQHAAEEWTRWDHGGSVEVKVAPNHRRCRRRDRRDPALQRVARRARAHRRRRHRVTVDVFAPPGQDQHLAHKASYALPAEF